MPAAVVGMTRREHKIHRGRRNSCLLYLVSWPVKRHAADMSQKNATEEDSKQENSELLQLPQLDIEQAMPRRSWHQVLSAQETVQPREWALYLCLEALAMANKDVAHNMWANVTISHRVLCAKMCLLKCGLQRSLRRLQFLHFIEVQVPGRSRRKATTYRVYSQSAVDEMLRLNGCTYYAMQGGRRKLFRALCVS